MKIGKNTGMMATGCKTKMENGFTGYGQKMGIGNQTPLRVSHQGGSCQTKTWNTGTTSRTPIPNGKQSETGWGKTGKNTSPHNKLDPQEPGNNFREWPKIHDKPQK